MANTDAPFGLRPAKHSGGGTARGNAYSIASTYGTDLFHGDPVRSTGTGRNIQIGTAGGSILGVFIGCEYTKSNGEYVFDNKWVASTALLSGTTATAYVWDDPQMLFYAQAAGDVAEADIGLLADLSSGTGNSSTGISAWEVGGHDGSEAQVKIMGKRRTPPANDYGTNAVVEILIMEHELRGNGVEV